MRKVKTTQRARSSKSAPAAIAPPTTAPPRTYNNCGGIYPRLLDALTSDQRKQYPMGSGLDDYFPDALAETSHISWAGNEKHNPGQPLHWARGKSNDHADCAARHLQQRGGYDMITINGQEVRVRHSAQLVWRALAILQLELEEEFGFELPRGATSA